MHLSFLAFVPHRLLLDFIILMLFRPHRRYPYFDVVAGLAWSDDAESYAGGRVATGRVSLAEQAKGDDPD
jgi:hypothetical protein